MHEADDAHLQALKEVLARSRELEHAPEHLIQKAMDAFDVSRRPAASPAGSPSALQRLLAVLTFDEIGSALSPVRASGPPTRRLVFSAGDIDVALSVTLGAMRGTWRIDGQCLGDDGPGEVQMICGDQRLQAPWSAQAEFSLEPVPPGDCRLVLRTARWEINLPPFELPPPG
jgi:hypothetical protein